MLNLLQSQLSFFGAIDEAVLYAKESHGDNPDAVLRIVGTLLPNTTGFGQSGWYHELLDFANRDGVRSPGLRGPVTFPTVEQSLEYLQASTAEERMRLATAALGTQPTPQPRTEPPSEPPPKGGTEPPPAPPRTPAALPERVPGSQYTSYHDPVLARSAYAAMVLARIADLGGLPPHLSAIPELPAQIMLAAVGSWAGPTLAGQTLEQIVNDLLDEAKQVESRQQWQSFAAKKVNQQFADQSLPCFGTLELFGDQYCSTLYTDTEDNDLSVDDIEKILDPRNWKLFAKFFCDVAAQQPKSYTACGWARILETIGPECAEWSMQTALLFFYGKDASGGLYLNYDLDPDRQDDSGMVEVDNGYIWIKPLNGTDPSQKGVQICTSKQERVQGLSPTATAALGCLLGWGTYANDLLSGTATEVRNDASIVTEPFVETVLTGEEKLSGVGQPVGGPAKLPPDFGHAMGDVRTLLTHHIERSQNLAAKAGERWLDGMTRDDVKEITKEFGKHLEKFAVEAYKTAESNVKPQVTPTNNE
ncbi:MAG TPA: hypothetical protein VMF30_19415 [Pirellulales bacterium]|nr:hypothetical protein [Pirellulales bacterium]